MWYGKQMNALYVVTPFPWIIGVDGNHGVNDKFTLISASADHSKPYILLW